MLGLTDKVWSPYVVGGLIGLLNVGSMVISKKVLGASTTYVKASGMVCGAISKSYVDNNEFFKKTKPDIDWGFMLVIGIVIGAFASAIISGDFGGDLVPSMWANAVGSSAFLRIGASIIGGAILGFGSRWAGGCTSGHGISGVSQLSVISIFAAISFFVGGIIMAFIIYGI